MYQQQWKYYSYFPSKPIILQDKWTRLRRIGQKELSPQTQLKLEWMIFYFTVAQKGATKTARHFGISRKTVHKWLRRWDETNLKSLEESSRRPDHTRTWTVTPQEEARVVVLRRQHLKWGKQKLQRVYRKVYPGESISAHKIQRVINLRKLYPEPDRREKRRRQARRLAPKTYIHTLEKKPDLGFLWHTDTIIIWWYGVRRVIFTALEEMTKIGYARVYTTNSSQNAQDFLKRLVYLSNRQLVNIHHDHGSEFADQFVQACQELGINQVYSRVRTPKHNPALERFNWTVQDEWLALSTVGLDDITAANQDLTEWLVEYNRDRPHQSLDYLTPLEYATQTFKVSPMWSASTIYGGFFGII